MVKLEPGIVSGSRRMTFDALEARARRLAAGLAGMGIGRGDCVAILMRNDIAFMEVAYGAQYLGAYSVPINWHFKAEEIAYILAGVAPRSSSAMPICSLPSPLSCPRACLCLRSQRRPKWRAPMG